MTEASRILYICGAAGTGSTLLDLLLGGHPEIVSTGEISHLPHVITRREACACGCSIPDCPVWRGVAAAVRRDHGVDLWKEPFRFWLGDVAPPRNVAWGRVWHRRLRRHVRRGLEFLHFETGVWRWIPLPPATRRAVRNTLWLYNAVAEASGKGIVSDSSKRYYRALELYEAAPDKVRVLFLIRDGRSVMGTVLRRRHGHAAAIAGWRRFYARAPQLLERHVHPEHRLTVRFENLYENPARELGRICEWAGIDGSHVGRMMAMEPGNPHSLGGSRPKGKPALAFRKVVDWRERLSPEAVALFERRAGAVNRSLGYG